MTANDEAVQRAAVAIQLASTAKIVLAYGAIDLAQGLLAMSEDVYDGRLKPT